MIGNEEIRDFLRAIRARLRPEDVGLTAVRQPVSTAQGRRVPGLRREEVAQLAGVSVDYYARLEQGRTKQVSKPVLDAIADALRMNETEREYLFVLVDLQTQSHERPVPSVPQRVRPSIHRMLSDVLSPAMVLGRGMQILAMNPLARALLFDVESVPYHDRNLAKWIFLDPEARGRYVDWSVIASDAAAVLRVAAGAHPGDRFLGDLVGELTTSSPEFRCMWGEHKVSECISGVVRILHPQVGGLAFDYEALDIPGALDQQLVVYVPAEDARTAEALSLLASWTALPSRAGDRNVSPKGVTSGQG
jgi:transcriptional regulator with XRE-family HTH domain